MVSVLMKKDAGGGPVINSGKEPPLRVANRNPSHSGVTILIVDPKRQGDRRSTGEQDVGNASKTKVLRALTHVECQLGLTLARIATIDSDESILQAETT